MSGKLVILRHKSWHVWNQDNQEKVLRDERIHREKEEASKKSEKEKIQQKTKDALNGEESDNVVSTHINFFEDFERAANFENAEYVKEKEKADQARMKREGVAPWALGDGSYEKKGKRAWYVSSATQISGDVNFSEVQEANKMSHDPMNSILTSSDSVKKPKINDNPVSDLNTIDLMRSTAHLKGLTKSLEISSAMLDGLRKKRLAREKKENRKINILLARHDIIG